MRNTSLYRALLLAVLALIAAACTDVQPTVDRTQPGAVKKTVFLTSEWFSAATVIDSPYGNTAFIGAGTSAAKITWDIEEHHLIARASRTHVDNDESSPTAGDGAGQPSIVAMYAIESHFDIRRAYNAVTGEEQNVIHENTTDRPWYERDYMRVDWSQNLTADLGVALTGGLGVADVSPISYYINDPSDPFAPKFEKDEADDVYYIDIVNKFILNPATTYYEALGETILACQLNWNAHLGCNPAEVAIRNSFLRVDPSREYQPMEYTADRMTRAGFFLTTQDTYDRDYGPIVSERLRLVNRHNLWQRSYARNDEDERVACESDRDCNGEDAARGAICDELIVRTMPPEKRPEGVSGYCTLPYRDREVRPIAYHLSHEFPEDLMPAAEHMAEGWNDAFSDVVGALREMECTKYKGKKCAEERLRKDGEDVFVLCHNPVVEDDHEACGKVGTIAALGDLRYSTVAWVADPHTSSPLGYGPSQTDTDTGEIFTGAAYVYGAPIDIYAALGRDMVALMNGDLEESQVTNNEAFSAWMDGFRKSQNTLSLESEREADRHVVKLDGADAERIGKALSLDWLYKRLGTDQGPLPMPKHGEWGQAIAQAKEAVADAMAETRLDRGQALLDRVKGTELERMMLTPQHLLTAGVDPAATVTDQVLEAASPLRGQSLHRLRATSEINNQIGKHQHTCALGADFVDESLLGLAREIAREAQGDGQIEWYGKQYKIATKGVVDYELVKRMLRIPLFHALTQHEVGHTIGLRHNFGGSFDSLNYFPEYWALRAADGTMRSRAWDPKTQEEIDGRIDEYAYTTVMDYGSSFLVSDAQGPGKYDRAALKLGYGDIIEVFKNVTGANASAVGLAVKLGQVGIGPLDLIRSPAMLRFIPYTQMPELVGGIESLEEREDVYYSDASEDPAIAALFGGNIKGQLGDELRSLDSQGRLVVPYFYCGDEFANQRPNCQQYDAGADEYETAMSMLDQYWNTYIFGSFMRNRLGFDPSARASSVYGRFFSRFQNWNLYHSYFSGLLTQIGGDPTILTREDGFGPFTLAIGASYGMLSRVIATPEPGSYAPGTMLDGSTAYQRGGAGSAITIDSFEGRAISPGYDFGPDFSLIFFTRAGFSQDKDVALQALLDSGRSSVFGTDLQSSDLRRLQISFHTTFQSSVNELMRGVIAEDWERYSPRWMGEGLAYPDASQQAGLTPMDGVLLDPNTEFTLQISAMVYSMALTPRTFSQTYIDRARLFVRGATESAEIDPSRPQVEFIDQRSGLVYVAPSYPDESGRETGVSAQAVLHAQALADAGLSEQLASYVDNLNALRMLTYLFGYGGDEASLGAAGDSL